MRNVAAKPQYFVWLINVQKALLCTLVSLLTLAIVTSWLWCHANSREVKSILSIYILVRTFCNTRGRNIILLESDTLVLYNFCHLHREEKKRAWYTCYKPEIKWWWGNHFACFLERNALFFNIINWGHDSKALFWSAYFSGGFNICFFSSTF